MRDSFTISYSPNVADALAGIRLAFWGSPKRIARTVLLAFVLPAFAGGTLLSLSGHNLSVAKISSLAVLFALAWGTLFMLAFPAVLARVVVKRQLQLGENQRITIDASGVEHRSNGSAHHLQWSAVSAIREHERVFLLLSGKRPIAAIEKSALRSDAELVELRSFLKALKPVTPA